MSTIKDLKPALVWNNFYQLTRYPRPSKHEEKVREFLLKWGITNSSLRRNLTRLGQPWSSLPPTDHHPLTTTHLKERLKAAFAILTDKQFGPIQPLGENKTSL